MVTKAKRERGLLMYQLGAKPEYYLGYPRRSLDDVVITAPFNFQHVIHVDSNFTVGYTCLLSSVCLNLLNPGTTTCGFEKLFTSYSRESGVNEEG